MVSASRLLLAVACSMLAVGTLAGVGGGYGGYGGYGGGKGGYGAAVVPIQVVPVGAFGAGGYGGGKGGGGYAVGGYGGGYGGYGAGKGGGALVVPGALAVGGGGYGGGKKGPPLPPAPFKGGGGGGAAFIPGAFVAGGYGGGAKQQAAPAGFVALLPVATGGYQQGGYGTKAAGGYNGGAAAGAKNSGFYVQGGSKNAAPVTLQQPVMVQARQVQAAPAQQQKQVQYAAPIVTYAQPIVQALDTSAPTLADQSYTASPIMQPTFQTAPLQRVQAISATAPTINKGYGTGLGLGAAGDY